MDDRNLPIQAGNNERFGSDSKKKAVSNSFNFDMVNIGLDLRELVLFLPERNRRLCPRGRLFEPRQEERVIVGNFHRGLEEAEKVGRPSRAYRHRWAVSSRRAKLGRENSL